MSIFIYSHIIFCPYYRVSGLHPSKLIQMDACKYLRLLNISFTDDFYCSLDSKRIQNIYWQKLLYAHIMIFTQETHLAFQEHANEWMICKTCLGSMALALLQKCSNCLKKYNRLPLEWHMLHICHSGEFSRLVNTTPLVMRPAKTEKGRMVNVFFRIKMINIVWYLSYVCIYTINIGLIWNM